MKHQLYEPIFGLLDFYLTFWILYLKDIPFLFVTQAGGTPQIRPNCPNYRLLILPTMERVEPRLHGHPSYDIFGANSVPQAPLFPRILDYHKRT